MGNKLILAGKTHVDHAEVHGWICAFETLLRRRMWLDSYHSLVMLGVGPDNDYGYELPMDPSDPTRWIYENMPQYVSAIRDVIASVPDASENLRRYVRKDMRILKDQIEAGDYEDYLLVRCTFEERADQLGLEGDERTQYLRDNQCGDYEDYFLRGSSDCLIKQGLVCTNYKWCKWALENLLLR